MTTVDMVRWFIAKRLCSPLDAVKLADAVVIRHTLKPERPRKGQVLLSFLSNQRPKMNCPFCTTENRIAPPHSPTCPHHELSGDKFWPPWWRSSYYDLDGEQRRCEWLRRKLEANPVP